METSDRTPTSSTAGDRVASAVERLATDGYVVLPDVVPADLVAELRDAVERTLTDTGTPFGANRFLGEHTRRVFNLLSHDPLYAQVPLHEPVLEVVEAVLGPELLLSSLTALDVHPGQVAQPLHADDANLPVPRPHDPLAVVAIWALSDFSAGNGGTRVVPGSHRFGDRPRPGVQVDTEPVEMAAGSVVVYDGAIWHGGGPNTSDGRRVGIICNHYAGWLRQEESQLLALTREQVAAFPPRLRTMIGYGTYRGLHGHVAGVDPGTWFERDQPTRMVWDRIR
jgi:ectoine hydroxylase-related dioxygenase (phytanoyl-CoA dioxygenase family)